MYVYLPYWLYQFAALLIHEIVFLDTTISTIRGILCKKYLFLVETRALDDNSSGTVASLVSSNASTRQ